MARILTGGPAGDLIPNESLDRYLFRFMDTHGDRKYLTNATKDTDITFRQARDWCRRLAAYLQGRGYGKGDTITLYGMNTVEFVCVTLGSIHAGLTVNTLNPAATVYELRHYLKEVNPRVIFTESPLLANIEAATNVLERKPQILLREKTAAFDDVMSVCLETDGSVKVIPQEVDAMHDVAFILFSSGTSGIPKGVTLTHYNVIAHNVLRQSSKYIAPETKKVLGIFPMYHAAGLFAMFGAIERGLNTVFLEKYNLELMMRSIQKYKPDMLGAPPPVLVALAKTPLVDQYDLSSIKYCNTGAAPLKSETEEAFKRRLNYPIINQGYGLTESVAGVVWSSKSQNQTTGQGSTGKVGLGIEIKIINPETGEILKPNTRGEILIRSPTVMKGYLNNLEATRTTIDKDGWLHSGDVGYYDDDGFLYVVDRLKELIKYKGNQVAPAELEALILEHPDVADVGVVGVVSSEAGEVPRAYVVRKEGSELVPDDLHKYVNDRVSNYKQLRGGIMYLSEIPKLPSGKILRRKLRELAKNESKL